MGIFNSFGAMPGQMSAKQEQLQVASALAEELKEPGKLAELLSSLRTGGQSDLIKRSVSGEAAPVTTAQLQQGLEQSGMLQNLATRTRMPTGVVKAGLAVLLPLALARLARDGYLTAEGEATGKAPIELDSLAEALR